VALVAPEADEAIRKGAALRSPRSFPPFPRAGDARAYHCLMPKRFGDRCEVA